MFYLRFDADDSYDTRLSFTLCDERSGKTVFDFTLTTMDGYIHFDAGLDVNESTHDDVAEALDHAHRVAREMYESRLPRFR